MLKLQLIDIFFHYMPSLTLQISTFHPSILHDHDVFLPVEMDSCFMCPLCDKFAQKRIELKRHLSQTHSNHYVEAGGFKMVRCLLSACMTSSGARGSCGGHYHCCFCSEVVGDRVSFSSHVSSCSEMRAAGGGEAARDSGGSSPEQADDCQGGSENVQYVLGCVALTAEAAAAEFEGLVARVVGQEFAAFCLVARALLDTRQLELQLAAQVKLQADKEEHELASSQESLQKPRSVDSSSGTDDSSEEGAKKSYVELEEIQTEDGLVLRRYQCAGCPSIFTHPGDLQRHVCRGAVGTSKRRKKRRRKEVDPPAMIRPARDSAEGRLQGGSQTSPSNENPRSANKPAKGESERKHKCSQCPAQFQCPGDLTSHTRAVHEKKWRHKCKECGSTFSVTANYKRHLLRHYNDDPFTCGVCRCSFPTFKGLRSHERYHEGLQPHPKVWMTCRLCDFSSAASSTLDAHFRAAHSQDV